jgi:hypothetical protein
MSGPDAPERLRRWKTSTDPVEMLRLLEGPVSARKMRLFWAACCRRLWGRMARPRNESLLLRIEVAERRADGRSSKREWAAALRPLPSLAGHVGHLLRAALGEDWPDPEPVWAEGPSHAVDWIIWESLLADARWKASRRKAASRWGFREAGLDVAGERAAQCDLLRDVFEAPFPRAHAGPWWRTPAAVGLATAVYEDRWFQGLPILGDALEEAGCTSVDALAHCRQGGEHVPGCWVLDTVLGKN